MFWMYPLGVAIKKECFDDFEPNDGKTSKGAKRLDGARIVEAFEAGDPAPAEPRGVFHCKSILPPRADRHGLRGTQAGPSGRRIIGRRKAPSPRKKNGTNKKWLAESRETKQKQ